MIRMICILAGIAPGDVHLAGGQVNDEGADGAFAVKRVNTFDIVVADRVWQVDVVFLNALQGFDRMFRALS